MIALRQVLLATVVSPVLFAVSAVQASTLSALNQALQPCLQGGKPQPCPAVLRGIDQLQASPAYTRADTLCKQQVRQFKEVVALMAIRDTTPIEAQSSFNALAQVCSTAGI